MTAVGCVGVIEYWSGSSYDFPAEEVAFRSTLDTDLYACAKAKAIARTIELSRDGSQFAMFTSDKCGCSSQRSCMTPLCRLEHIPHARVSSL